ncbi:AAA family ATPase [Halogeometricum limi]|uniref:AAA domain-containing protein, putative AbiEii toxin, Type IV TA system n=1 Tax=Halogeometricum limi TaxID=555875 RepID=A0A1I6FWA7_9EURY|nr:AAA family ATPase [Halogeometricum limi]SFR34087.1 AAA domain-containing protein, putative AbiEii toxin, Type IV TA system [Halogeometricum limi]
MRLEQIHLENYRSFKEVTFDVDDLQILFGRNNVGKSNILHALKDYREFGVGTASFEDRYSQIARNWHSDPLTVRVEFSLEQDEIAEFTEEIDRSTYELGEQPKKNFASKIAHEFTVNSNGVGSAKVEANYDGEMHVVSLLNFRDDNTISLETANLSKFPEISWSSSRTGDVQNTHSVLGISFRRFLADCLESWKWTSPFRHPDPRGPVEEAYSLDSESNNLAVVLHTLSNNDRDTFRAIENSFVEIMEGVTGLSTPIETDHNTKTTVVVHEEKAEFDLRDISAGSQQILALLTELETAGTQTDLLLLEEPETHLHPGAQRTIYNTIKQVAEETDTQIILTTHSEVFIDSGDSSRLIKATREDGDTVFSKVDEDVENEAMSVLGYEKSRLLQSRAVVFVEGLSDKRVISNFAKGCGFSLEDNGIRIIDLEGEGNIKSDGQSLVKLVSEFDIPFLFIVDSHDNEPRIEQNELLQAINAPGGDWQVTKEDVFVWEGYGIESYLLSPDAIASHLGADVDAIEELLEKYGDREKPAEILEEVFQEILSQEFIKENDGPLIAAKMDHDDVDPEVGDAIDRIQSLLD